MVCQGKPIAVQQLRMKLFLILSLMTILPTLSQATDESCLSLYSFKTTKTPKQTRPEIIGAKIFAAADVKTEGPGIRDITVNDPDFYRRVLSDPDLEIGETYMDGLWDSPSIDQLTYKLMSAQKRDGRLKSFLPLLRSPFLAVQAIFKYGYRYFRDRFSNRQTRTLSKNVAKEHYDVGNELYRRMLDPTLTYTSGVWAKGYDLEDAQNAKYDLLARKLGLKPGDRVLDIGSGFGGFARFAAKNYGAKVTGITISIEQLKAARALSEGIKDVEFVFSDYRDIPHRFPKNTFDHIVSIEMIEAVGVRNLPDYFEAANASLKEGGRFVIQGIANHQDVVNTNAWFSKYIFHNGVAPSNRQVDQAAKNSFGAPADRQRFADDYDKTLLNWHSNFTKAWPDLKESYSERFKRMWDFYLLSVAGGFRSEAVQLHQVVYVKGGNTSAVVPVRDLPSRERLDAMRLSESEKAKTAALIGELEIKKNDLKQELKPRNNNPPIALRKDARIAIIGAGPSGLSSARELKRLGFTNVVVYEKESEVGGKTHTVNIDGKIHDLGATMGVKLKYKEIEQLAKENSQATIRFPKEVQYSLETGKPREPRTFRQTFQMGIQALLYMIQHRRLSKEGAQGLEVPADELADPFSVVMKRNGLEPFSDHMKTYLTGYGYGGPETPAVFGMRMMDPNAIVGAALAPSLMWENGTQPIWKGVASKLNVQTNHEIQRIERKDGTVRLHFKGSKESVEVDKIIMAIDPQAALKTLDATSQEISLFSQVKYMPYATFAVRVDGLADGKAEVGYLKENMTLDREGRPMAWIKRHKDDNIFVVHLFAPPSFSDEQIVSNISEDLKRLGAKNVTYVESRRWPFFPHVDSKTMREEHFYQRAKNLQGLNNTVFVNEALGMSTMPDSAQQGREAAARLATGEY